MLDAIRPLLTDLVGHRHAPSRDIYGQPFPVGDDERYLARVVLHNGRRAGRGGQEQAPDAAATVWLLNHPNAVAIGDAFTLPNGDVLSVIGFELRTLGGDTLHKVKLS